MILLCGIPGEGPMRRVLDEVRSRGLPHVMFDQRDAPNAALRLEVVAGRLGGELTLPDRRVDLAGVTGAYLRLMDDRALPALASEPEGSPRRLACRRLHDLLIEWAEATPARVINRASAMASNGSKPYQAQLILRHGFAVPETLVTNDPEAVAAFAAVHGPLIYKSISSARSIVEVLDAAAMRRLERIRWCPVQFQERIPGVDVRVHTVAGRVFATRIETAAVDYRYAARHGEEAELTAVDLDDELAGRCLALAADLGLELAGIDLRLTDDGRVVCFEVNPSPAYSYYESHTGQPIAAAVATALAGGEAA